MLKNEMVEKHKKGSRESSFFNLLPSAKQKRIQAYKELPRVQQWLSEGKEVVSCLVCFRPY